MSTKPSAPSFISSGDMETLVRLHDARAVKVDPKAVAQVISEFTAPAAVAKTALKAAPVKAPKNSFTA